MSPPTPSELGNPQLLDRRQLAERLKITTRTLSRRQAAGLILDPTTPAGCFPRWWEPEVLAWLAARMPKRDDWRRRNHKTR